MSTQAPTQAADQSANEPRVPSTAVDSSATPEVKLFDRSPTKHIRFRVMHPEGVKVCLVRFPTDDEWCARARQTVSVRKSLDGGRSKTETPRETEISAALFNKIRVDMIAPEGTTEIPVSFDDAEAEYVINRLEACTPVSCERIGVNYTIVLTTFNGIEVTHELKMPSQKQRMDFARASIQITSQRQTLETKIALEPTRALWEALKVEGGIKGYAAAGVPIVHMSAAVNELLAQVNADAEAMEKDPEF